MNANLNVNGISAETLNVKNFNAEEIESDSIKVNGKQVITEIPIASDSAVGGIKVGSNLAIDADGTLNATGGESHWREDGWGNIALCGSSIATVGSIAIDGAYNSIGLLGDDGCVPKISFCAGNSIDIRTDALTWNGKPIGGSQKPFILFSGMRLYNFEIDSTFAIELEGIPCGGIMKYKPKNGQGESFSAVVRSNGGCVSRADVKLYYNNNGNSYYSYYEWLCVGMTTQIYQCAEIVGVSSGFGVCEMYYVMTNMENPCES